MAHARCVLGLAILAASATLAQDSVKRLPEPAPPVVEIDQPDAQRTQQELMNLFQRYPPSLHGVLALDPSLLTNDSYLAPYPALRSFLRTHPEIARDPTFYIGSTDRELIPLLQDRPNDTGHVWEQIVTDISMFAGFALAISLIAWLIRTFIDYRRWNRLANVQTEVHRKLMDRFTSNEDLLAYINSPAGSKFLESAPITLDAGPRASSGPIGRILWTVQGGVVLMAGGFGLQGVAGRLPSEAAQPLHALGVLGVALGVGLVISAIISFVLSRRLGLLERVSRPAATSNP
jgi:hypothetical protein